MVESSGKNESAYREAESLLGIALDQVNEINKALAENQDPRLESASERAAPGGGSDPKRHAIGQA
jgi:hypothetical protein